MIKDAKRISIIGGCGTGKTTLSNNLGNILNLPVYHIDAINYFENWKERDKEERDKIILKKANEDEWIIDGTYHSTLKTRLEKADIVIYLDYSTFAQLVGVLGRSIKANGKEKKEIPGCKERMTWEFFLWTLKWRKNKRKQIIYDITEINNNKVLTFKSRRQLNKWYKNEFNKTICIDI